MKPIWKRSGAMCWRILPSWRSRMPSRGNRKGRRALPVYTPRVSKPWQNLGGSVNKREFYVSQQQKAAAHGDVVAQTIEETKLKTLRQIWAFYQQTEGKG